MLQQHLWTSLRLFKAVVPQHAVAVWGRIVAVSSPTASGHGRESHPMPSAQGGAGGAGADAGARNSKGSGVTANLVVVSTIDVKGERESKPAPSNANWTTPDEITATLLYLCADESATINGARIPLYGG